MSIQPTDIAILLISVAACIYCFVLNRRLRALQDTKDGLGATIVAFSKSASDMTESTQQTRSHAGQIAARLTELLTEANTASDRLETLSRSFDAEHCSLIDAITIEADKVCDRIQVLTRDLETRSASRLDAVSADAETEFQRIKSRFEGLTSAHEQRLDDALELADNMCEHIEAKTQDIESRNAQTLSEVKAAQAEFNAEMRIVFSDCAEKAVEMTALAAQMRDLSGRTKFVIEAALQRTANSMLLAPKDMRVEP